jgi:hypothetical protein
MRRSMSGRTAVPAVSMLGVAVADHGPALQVRDTSCESWCSGSVIGIVPGLDA